MNVSVIMPVYNAEKTIFEAVKSILGQSYCDFEFIIIDDGSTDTTVSIIKSFVDDRIVLLHNEVNKGIIESLNYGIQKAKGEYIFRMDADDIAHSDRFEKQLKFMIQNPEYAICGSFVKEFGDSNMFYRFDTDSEEIKVDLLFFNTISHPSIIINTKNIKKEDLFFDKRYLFVEDYEFFTRIASYSKIANYPENLLMYRIHTDQIKTKKRAEQFENTVNISQKQIETIFGAINDSQKKACYAIVKAVYGQKSNTNEIHDVEKLFDDLIDFNKKNFLFEEKILENKKKFFIGLVS